MSALASAGSLVGGGAAIGPAVIGVTPALVTVGVTQIALRNGDPLPEHERAARRDGRVASLAGASGATAGGVAAIGAMGTTAGFSSAGIASGLASIGAIRRWRDGGWRNGGCSRSGRRRRRPSRRCLCVVSPAALLSASNLTLRPQSRGSGIGDLLEAGKSRTKSQNARRDERVPVAPSAGHLCGLSGHEWTRRAQLHKLKKDKFHTRLLWCSRIESNRSGVRVCFWCVASLLEATKHFRCVNGHLHLKALRTAPNDHV